MNADEVDPARMQYFNPTVAGAFEALEHLASAVDPVSVTEITSATRLTRGTALRVMRTLAETGVARDVGGAKYVAGARLMSIALRVNTTSTLANVVQPHLEELTRLTEETSHFAVLSSSNGRRRKQSRGRNRIHCSNREVHQETDAEVLTHHSRVRSGAGPGISDTSSTAGG